MYKVSICLLSSCIQIIMHTLSPLSPQVPPQLKQTTGTDLEVWSGSRVLVPALSNEARQIRGTGLWNLWSFVCPYSFQNLKWNKCAQSDNKESKQSMKENIIQLVSWCFEPCQPQRITSGLNTNFSLSPSSHFTSHHTTKSLFFSPFIFRGHSTREPASSRVTYFILRAYTGTMC